MHAPSGLDELTRTLSTNDGSTVLGYYQQGVLLVLEQRFGKAANGLSPSQFLKAMESTVFSDWAWRCAINQETRKALYDVPAHPSQWHFNHYGSLFALLRVAYCSLTLEEQESAPVQERFACAALGGKEDLHVDASVLTATWVRHGTANHASPRQTVVDSSVGILHAPRHCTAPLPPGHCTTAKGSA